MKRLTKQIIGGIIGAALFGLMLGYILWMYGANNGCFSFIDAIMNDQGYTSCAPFGFYAGALIGAVVGMIFASLNWRRIIKKLK